MSDSRDGKSVARPVNRYWLKCAARIDPGLVDWVRAERREAQLRRPENHVEVRQHFQALRREVARIAYDQATPGVASFHRSGAEVSSG